MSPAKYNLDAAQQITQKLLRQFGKQPSNASPQQMYQAVAMTVRDELMEYWQKSTEKCETGRVLYYLSMEFLTGKFLRANLLAIGRRADYAKAAGELGFSLEDIENEEPEPGLGNGGLGRLAACFMDSLSCMSLNAVGCGIRYDLGLFRQKIVEGEQVELPDNWLASGSVWEIPSPEEEVSVLYGGRVVEYHDENGNMRHKLLDASRVIATPYDYPVCGFENGFCNTLRLWSARSPEYINMRYFSEGDYIRASAERELAETISRVLYPNDSHNSGKSLRLRQQYFFTSATLQHILRRHKSMGRPVSALADYVAVQINDTHPSIAVPELMRLLMDEEYLGWDEAFDICRRVFSYTNHTIMPEALESWPLYLLENLLPRIYMIIKELDRRFRFSLSAMPRERADKMSIIAYGNVRMANLCLSSCHRVNGVSALHTDILRKSLFSDFQFLWPEKIVSITNGVSPRRWLLQANPGLSGLIGDTLGGRAFITDLSLLAGLEEHSQSSGFLSEYERVKRENKARLSNFLLKTAGRRVDPDSIFDVHVKRLHEYKRQLLNVLHILYLYFDILENGGQGRRPHTFIFGAKASPGYARAKQIIALINAVSELIEKTPEVRELLSVVFVENYNAGSAELIIPAADISQQISLAGKEASGTGNMKFMINGALTIGTYDGANVEMHGLLGDENIFIFGLSAADAEKAMLDPRRSPEQICAENGPLRRVVYSLGDGTLPGEMASLMNYLLTGEGGAPDPYLCLTDFASYAAAHAEITALYSDRQEWLRRSVINTARSGFFSSDRSIGEYNRGIWRL